MASDDTKREITRRHFLAGMGMSVGMLQLTSCGGSQTLEWLISQNVFTTAQQQIFPIGLAQSTPQIGPCDLPLYHKYGYDAWQIGPGLPHVPRKELAPAYSGAPNAATLLPFFAMTDIHIADKESPAQPIYLGSNASYGPTSAGLSSAYTPILLSTTQMFDAAVQTINALHKKSPVDFGIFLGDATKNSQYNELRWYIDVLDGKLIEPSSGAHAGAFTIDYQRPFKAARLDSSIPWYQVIGNHDSSSLAGPIRTRDFCRPMLAAKSLT